ncbi:MAG: polysaccharide deacetylase family protein [Clostridiales bacterium]
MLVLDLRKKRLWFFLMAIVLILAVLFFFFNYLESNYLFSAVSQTVRSLPIYKVDTTENKLSISFDASWGAEHTEKILDILDKYQIKATFFLVNIWLEDYPEMAQKIAARGHEIGLHSTTHPHFSQLSENQMEEELKTNWQKIQDITKKNAILFRPPFGDYDNRVIKTSENLGYIPIQWSIDSLDWKDLSSQEIQNRVLKNIGPGDIVLFHNNGKYTAEALEPILENLQKKNLQVVPIGELIFQKDYYIDYNGVQHCKN